MNPSTSTADSQSAPELPLTDGELDEIAMTIAFRSVVVGLGESTRSARETFVVRDRLFRRLVRDHGFRALALQDDTRVAGALDRYVADGTGTARSALDRAFAPWRTTEMVSALEWIRRFNIDHPEDRVRIFAVKPAQPQDEDYDLVLDSARRTTPDPAEGSVGALAAHLEAIRTAHRTAEHVQTAQGIHPGLPFAQRARAALSIIEALPIPNRDSVVERMRWIVDFHEHSPAATGNYAGDAYVWAESIIDFHRTMGVRIAYWDGIAHTAASPTVLGIQSDGVSRPTAGSVLRSGLGRDYRSIAIGFHHGNLGSTHVPAPGTDLLDARMDRPDSPGLWWDLAIGRRRWAWDRPAKVRVISGIYDPSRDDEEYLAVESLTSAFDVLIHIHEATPVTRLS